MVAKQPEISCSLRIAGKRFEVLTTKTFNKKDVLSLRVSIQDKCDVGTGVIAIPRDWTDRADINPYQDVNFTPILSYSHLCQLTELVDILMQIKPED